MYKVLVKKEDYKRAESGFSLVEMMIAITIFLAVMAAVFGVFRIGIVMRDSINNRSETSGNARTAINSVGREAVNAGLGYSRTGSLVPDDFAFDLLRIPKDSGNDRDLFTGVMAGNDISSSQLSVNGEKNDVIAFIYRDLHFNDGNALTITNASTFFNSVVLETPTNGCVNCKKYDLYLVESADGNKALALSTFVAFNKFISLNDNDPLGLNRQTNGNKDWRSILTPCSIGDTTNCFNYQPQATAKKVYLMSYSVDDEGTLIRTTYGNNTGENADAQIQKQPLAYNVQSFQAKYLMQDGTSTDDPSNGNTEQAKMNEVVQVQINITIKAADGGVSNTSRLLNLTSTFSTRNLRYDVE
jgi:prepilin-type N-terminal cleavage/methylation domain-containing protein